MHITQVSEDIDLQDLQEEAQSLTITKAREEEQQKAANLIALKTLEQEGDTKVSENTDVQEEAQAARQSPIPGRRSSSRPQT